MPVSIFGLKFDVSSRGEGNLDQIADGLVKINAAAQVSARRAIAPMVKSINQIVGSLAKIPQPIANVSKALLRLSDPARVSVSALDALRATLKTTKQVSGPLSATMRDFDKVLRKMSGTLLVLTSRQQAAEMGAKRFLVAFRAAADPVIVTRMNMLKDSIARVGAELKIQQALAKLALAPPAKLTAAQIGAKAAGLDVLALGRVKDLKDELTGLKAELKAIENPYNRIVSAMQKLASGGKVTSRTVEELMSTVRNLGRGFGYTEEWARPLVARLARMRRALSDTEATARTIVSNAIKPMARSLQETLDRMGVAPGILKEFQQALLGLEGGRATAIKVLQVLNQVTVTAEELGKLGLKPMADQVRAAVPELEKLHRTLVEQEGAQRQVNRSIAAGIPRTKEQIDTLRLAQSAAHGLMMGSSILSLNLRSLAFNVVFLRFSMTKLVFATAALTVAFGLLAKAAGTLISLGVGLVKGFFSLIIGAVKSLVSLVAKAVKGLISLVVKAAKGGVRLLTNILKGAFKVVSGILDEAFQLFDKTMNAIAQLVTQAVKKVAASLKAMAKAALEEGMEIDKLTARIRRFVGTQAEAARGMDFFREEAARTGYTVEDLAEAWMELAENFEVTPRLWKAALNLAAANAKQATETAAAMSAAIGKEKSNLASLWSWGIRVTKAEDKRLTLLGRQAALTGLLTQIETRFTGSLKEQAGTYESLVARIGILRKSILSLIATPFIKDFIVPILKFIVKLGQEIYYLTKSVIDFVKASGLWASALQTWKDALDEFMPTLREMWIGIKIVLVGAIFLAVAAFKVLGWIVGRVLKAVAGLWAWFKKWLQVNKPLWDSIRRMAQALKEMDWAAFLQGAKDFIANLPPQLYAALLAAIGLIALFFGAKLASAIATSLLGQEWGTAVNALFAGLAIALVAGIWKLSTDPRLQKAWFGLLDAIREDLVSGRYLEALAKIGGALLTGITTGLLMAIYPPGEKRKLTDEVTDGLNEAMEAITAGDVLGGVKQLGGLLKDAISEEWLRVLVIGLIAAVATAFGSPALGIVVAGLAAFLLPSSAAIKTEVFKWTRDFFGPALADALEALISPQKVSVPEWWDIFPGDMEIEVRPPLLERLATFALELVRAIGIKLKEALGSPEGQSIIGTIIDIFGSIIVGGLDFLTQLLEKNKPKIVGFVADILNAITDAITGAPEVPIDLWAVPYMPVLPEKVDLSGIAGSLAKFFATVFEIVRESLIDSGALVSLVATIIDEFVKFIETPETGGRLSAALGGLFGAALQSAIDILFEAEKGEEPRIIGLGKALGGAMFTGFKAAMTAFDPTVIATAKGVEKAVGRAFPIAIAFPWLAPALAPVVAVFKIGQLIGQIKDLFAPSKTVDLEREAEGAGKRTLGGGSPGFLGGVEIGWIDFLRPYLEETVVAGITGLLTVDLLAEEWGTSLLERFQSGIKSRLSTLLDYLKEVGKKIRSSIEEGIGDIVIRPRVVWPSLTPPTVTGAGGGITGLQHGGIVRKPTLALLHAGEAVIPLNRMGGERPINVNVYVTDNNILDDAMANRLADKVGQAIVRKLNRRFQVGFVGIG